MEVEKKVFKVFIVMSLILLLIDGVLLIIRFGLTGLNLRMILSETISNLLISFFISVLLYSYLLFLKRKHGKDILDLVKIGDLHLSGKMCEIFANSVASFKENKEFKDVIALDNEKKIVINTGISWKSFGESIEIIFLSEGNGVKICITSKPKIKSTLYDYGKNSENIVFIKSLLASAR